MNCRFERKLPPYEKPDAALIWHPSQRETYYDVPRDAWCRFRRTVTLDGIFSDATVKIFADSRYLLYVNGIEVATGPCRSDPRWQYYDEIDITPYLQKGDNVIAALVLYFGYGTGQSISRVPALYADVKVTVNGTKQAFSSGEGWLCSLMTAHDPTAPRVNGCKGRSESFDNRKYEDGWQLVGYDDSAWSTCHCRKTTDSPYWNLAKRPIAMLKRRLVPAEGIVSTASGQAVTGYDAAHHHWAVKEELAAMPLRAYTGGFPYTYVGEEGRFGAITVDFAQIYVGTLVVEAEGSDGDVIDVVYAESLFDGKPQYDGVAYRPLSRFVLREGKNYLPVFFQYEAFRHVVLLLRAKGTLTVTGVSVWTREYPFDKRASFSCENASMNRLWDISAHTLEICLQDGYLDSPSREQQQWMGDGRYQAIMNYYYSGDVAMTEKMLLQFAQSQDCQGMTASRYPDANHNLAPIPTYCLQWLCGLADYYRYTGKTDLICEVYPGAVQAIRWFSAFENEEGLLCDLPYWNYCDMGMNREGKQGDFYRGGCITFHNVFYVEAMSAVILLAEIAEDREAVSFFTAKKDRLIEAIRANLWDESKGCYADCRKDGVLSDSVSESVNALAIIGFERGERAKAIDRAIFDPVTRVESVVEVSVYSMILLGRALKLLGRDDLAVKLYLERYRTMLASGAETTWEHWWLAKRSQDGEYSHFSSACHAWGAAALVLVAENILGIGPGQPEVTIPDSMSALLGRITATLYLPDGHEIRI